MTYLFLYLLFQLFVISCVEVIDIVTEPVQDYLLFNIVMTLLCFPLVLLAGISIYFKTRFK